MKSNYIGQQAIVDKDEFNETSAHINSIKDEIIDFIEKYIKHVNGTNPLHNREFTRRYRFSTLPYFHAELGLP